MDYKHLENILATLCSVPEKAVYALINEKERVIQISPSKNVVGSLSKLVSEMGSRNNNELRGGLNEVKFIVLESELRDDAHMQIRASYWKSYYKGIGYRFYSDNNPVDCSVRKTLRYKGRVLYYVVEIVNRSKEGRVVGVFRKHKEADEFIQTHYLDGVKDIVISDNEHTRMWMGDEYSNVRST